MGTRRGAGGQVERRAASRALRPARLAWLLGRFPVRPLPLMLVPLGEGELEAFRADLQERLRLVAVPAE